MAISLDDQPTRWSRRIVVCGVLAIIALISIGSVAYHSPQDPHAFGSYNFANGGLCRQPEKAESGQFASSKLLTLGYREKSAELLGGAVRIPTESFDDMAYDPQKDARFEVFGDLHAYLHKKFPLIAAKAETINTYGLLYTIEGREKDLEPLVLMAHQDVVPVNSETVEYWTHEPFSGYFDGDRVWGRGALDTKNSIVAILEAAEALLDEGWQPNRTVIVSFGFDEELDGSRGAGPLADAIEARYGRNSIYMIVDEGSGLSEANGALFASPSVAEKGYTDIEVTLDTPGGHSSVPPDHTGIGIMAELVTLLEAHKNAFTPSLTPDSVVGSMFECLAAHAPDVSPDDRELWSGTGTRHGREKLAHALASNIQTRQFVQTTQAVDIVHGGVKVNALPEQVSLVVNYRIDVGSSVAAVTDRFMELAKHVANERGLSVVLNNVTVIDGPEEGSHGVLYVANAQSLDPAPIAPFSVEDETWAVLGATSRYVFEDLLGYDRLYMAPSLMTGNTDTVHYWNLTSRIYRYTPALGGGNAHTVDEYITIDSHISTVVWYHQFLQVF